MPPARKATPPKEPPRADATPRVPTSPAPARVLDRGAAVVLTGPPGLLRTTVSVENVADQRVAVRGSVLHREGQEPVTGTAAALIAPGATATVPVTFRVDPSTAPGEHHAEVEVGGQRRAAFVVVEPQPSLRVSPRRVLAEPGDTVVALTVQNDGNVPMPLARSARARTDDGGPDPGPDVWLTFAGSTTVHPGATVLLEGRVTVPDGLDPTRRHVATVPVGTADLEVIVLPRTASE